MRSPSDPIRSARGRVRATWLVGGLVVASCATWAALPRERSEAEPVELGRDRPGPGAVAPAGAGVDPDAFAAVLWDAPPAAVPEPARVEARRPPRLTLIAISHEGGTLRAAIYDPDADRLRFVSPGDRIGPHTIGAITEDGVELSAGRATSRLLLNGDGS